MTRTFLFLLPLILSGCMGIYEGGFECPPGEGTKCKSISEVNELINRGQKSGCQVSGRQGCPVISEHPSTPPDPLSTAIMTPDIWYSPWGMGSETRDPLLPQKRKGDHESI